MVSYRERIRVDGRAIPEADLLRILSDLAPYIDQIEATLSLPRYFSPQGIFLAIALRWFDELNVSAAVLEVGRGGRFDDIAVVPNKLSLFTPILIEHPRQLGNTLERIAWHKAGIIKPYSYAYSVPQASEVLRVMQSEADALDAEFAWIAPTDMGEYLGRTEHGLRMRLGRYGDLDLSLNGKYQVENATLAVQGAGNLHGRLAGIPHGSQAYVDAIRAGLADVTWAGRLQKLDDAPAIYIDGATNIGAARSFIESLDGALTHPLVSIIAVPEDRDYPGMYRTMSAVSDHVILTHNTINPKVRFPDRETALAAARQFHTHVEYADNLGSAVERARALTGKEGTILIAAAQPVVGEALSLWGLTYEQI
jgi:dihydrofolate synthase/folylpolyglutamate synthase